MARKPKEAITPDTDISNFSPEVQKRLREELDKYLSDKLAMETKPASQDDNIISVDENNSDNLLKKVSIEKEIEQHPKTIEESLEKEIDLAEKEDEIQENESVLVVDDSQHPPKIKKAKLPEIVKRGRKRKEDNRPILQRMASDLYATLFPGIKDTTDYIGKTSKITKSDGLGSALKTAGPDLFSTLFPDIAKVFKYFKKTEDDKKEQDSESSYKEFASQRPIINALNQTNHNILSLNDNLTDSLNNSKKITSLLQNILESMDSIKPNSSNLNLPDLLGGGSFLTDLLGLGKSTPKSGNSLLSNGLSRGKDIISSLFRSQAVRTLSTVATENALPALLETLAAGAATIFAIKGAFYLADKLTPENEKGAITNPISLSLISQTPEKYKIKILTDSLKEDGFIKDREYTVDDIFKKYNVKPEERESFLKSLIDSKDVQINSPISLTNIEDDIKKKSIKLTNDVIESNADLKNHNLAKLQDFLVDLAENFYKSRLYDTSAETELALPEFKRYMTEEGLKFLKITPATSTTSPATPAETTPTATPTTPAETTSTTPPATPSATPAETTPNTESNVRKESFKIGGETISKGNKLSSIQISAIRAALQTNPENRNLYPEWVINQYNEQIKNATPVKPPEAQTKQSPAATPAGTTTTTPSGAQTKQPPAATPSSGAPKTGPALKTQSESYDQSKRPTPPPSTASPPVGESGKGGGATTGAKSPTDMGDPGNVEPPNAAERFKELFKSFFDYSKIPT